MEYTNLTTEQLRDPVCVFTSLGTLFLSSWHRVCSRIFHHLWKYLKWPVESDTLCLHWRTAVSRHVGKFSVNAADSLLKSRRERERRRYEAAKSSPQIPTPPILLHRQIRVRERLKGCVHVCVWNRLTRNHWVIKHYLFCVYVCVWWHLFPCLDTCLCLRVSLFLLSTKKL